MGVGEVAVRMLAGRYRLSEIVGRGGSAVVHRGFDRTLKRPVAVKLFSPYRPQTGDFATAVLREAQTAARLNHPNVARVYDYGEVIDGDERTPYLIMEFLDGETLADLLAREGAVEWQRAAGICAAIAAALAAAHQQDSVHRDVKPRNIMLSPGGVKVLDFGIAAAAGQSSFDTRGRLWGTAAYLAPEQLRGDPAFPAADVYALGLLLFECLTGKPAWKGETVGEILASRHDRPVPPLPRVAGLPRELTRLYRACTAAEPGRRPSATSAADILHTAAGTLPVLRRSITSKPAGAQQTSAKKTTTRKAAAKQAAGKQAAAEQATAGQATAKQATAGQATAKQATANQAAAARQATAEQATAGQSTANQAAAAMQATAGQAIANQAAAAGQAATGPVAARRAITEQATTRQATVRQATTGHAASGESSTEQISARTAVIRPITIKQAISGGRPGSLRRRTTLVASAAVATALLSAAGLQLANAASTPSGRPAEAAVDGTRPAVVSPQPSKATPSPTTPATQGPTHWMPVVTHTTVPTRRYTTEPTRPATTPPTTAPGKPSPSPSGPSSSPSPTPTGSPSPTPPDDDPTTSPPPSPTATDSPTTNASTDDDTALA